MTLPSSVETYLLEADFSATELLILRHLLRADALTLRELASKTGKSTGVLDQAMKKLIHKEIVAREVINGTDKCALGSLDAITRWMEQDMHRKRQVMIRRYQDFETFIATLKRDKARPEMEYFEGRDGIERAYRQLLASGQEMLQYVPITQPAEEDPLREFRGKLNRERHRRGIFARVIAHSTPLGRRFQSRDPFEFRRTLLAAPAACPIIFEKVIVGDTVACFDHVREKACFIRYPEFADSETAMFNHFWRQLLGREKRGPEPVPVTTTKSAPPELPIITVSEHPAALSHLQELFLSRASIVSSIIFAAIAGAITFGAYTFTEQLTLNRMRDRIQSIAATGALQIDALDLDQLRAMEDYRKPAWATVTRQLMDIHQGNADIKYVYMFRKSADGNDLEFVGDSYAMNPLANFDDDPGNDVDMNQDGMIDGSPTGGDYLAWPGQYYPDPPSEAFAGFNGTTSNRNFYEDQFGKVLSGYAPIRDANGNAVAVLAIDMHVSKLRDLTQQVFSPLIVVATFFLLFLAFVFIRLSAFHRSLLREMWTAFHLKTVLVTSVLACMLAVGTTYGLSRYTAYLNLQRIRERAMGIAATGSIQFGVHDIDGLRSRSDIHKPQYEKVLEKLNEIRSQNPIVQYTYIMRPTDNPYVHIWVADADSIAPDKAKDMNNDGLIDEKDALSFPGDIYSSPGEGDRIEAVFTGVASADSKPYSDQWGTFISGYGPIKNERGNVVAFLGVDIDADMIEELTPSSLQLSFYFFGLLIFFIALQLITFNRQFLKNLWKAAQTRRALLSLAFCAMIAYWVKFVLYFHTLRVLKEEVSARLESIAAAAALQIDARDLEPLRFARDMRREEYQRVFTMLNNVRDLNEDIVWAYILRRTETNDLWEFVVDADSNYNLPFYIDYNEDGVLEEDEENVAPGVRYATTSPEVENGFISPTSEKDFYADQWGITMTGYAPIKDSSSHSVAVIAFSIDISEVLAKAQNNFLIPLWFFAAFIMVLVIKSISLEKLSKFLR